MSSNSASTSAEQLAIDGGQPVRTAPLPWEFPGAGWMNEEERELVMRVVDAHSPFRFYGPQAQHMVDVFEKEWCEKYGHKHALGVSSGTAGLSIAMSALGLGPGDEVLVPGYLWVSCVSAVVRSGAIPRLVDVDKTFCLDPNDLREKIGPQTRAVLCVHMSGAPGRIDEIAALCRENRLALIEDCAQASGASFKGQAVGTFGDIGVFSFQLNKNMTSGEGGMVVTQSDALFKRIVALHDLGYPRTPAGRLDTSDPNTQLWGVGARMPELTGAMDPAGDSGPFMLMLLPTEDHAQRFVDALKAEGIRGPDGSLACLTMRDWGLHWYSNIPSLVNKRSNSADGFPWSHPLNSFAEQYSYEHGALPECDAMHARGALLTIASVLKDNDINDIITAIKKVSRAVLS